MYDIEAIKSMLSTGDIKFTDYLKGTYNTPIDIAIDNINLELLSFMIDEGLNTDMDYDPPLLHQITNNLFIADNRYDENTQEYLELAKLLLDKGANPNTLNGMGRTALEMIPHLADNDIAMVKRSLSLADMLFNYGAYMPTDVTALFDFFYRVINSYERDEVIFDYFLDKTPDISIVNDSNQTMLQYLYTYEEAIKLLINRSDIDINNQDNFGDTLLLSLCNVQHTNPNLISELISMGADPNTSNNEGYTPLHLCRNPDALSVLVNAGADVNMLDNYGETPLHRCYAHIPCMVSMLDGYPDPHIVNNKGELALHKVIKESSLDDINLVIGLIDSLMDMGFDINTIDSVGNNLAHCICYSRSDIESKVTILKALIDRALDLSISASSDDTCISIACMRGDIPILEAILNQVPESDDHLIQSALSNAVSYNQIEVINYLLNSYLGIDLNFTVNNSESLLHIACKKKYYEIVKLLLDRGVDIEYRNIDDRTPFNISFSNNDIRTINLLLDYGADVNTVDNKGISLLHLATKNGQLSLVKLLIENGADPNVRDDNGLSPLHFSVSSKKLQILKFLIEEGADIDCADNQGYTPLLLSIYDNFKMAYMYLLEYGTDIQATTNDGDTALHFASKKGINILIGKLMSYGADIDAVNAKGQTPLHIACARGNHSVVQSIIKHSPSLDIEDKWGDRAVDVASENGYSSIVKLLI